MVALNSMRWRVLVIFIASCFLQIAHAGEWNCADTSPAPPVDKRTAREIELAFQTDEYIDILQELKRLRSTKQGASLVAVYEAQAFAYQTLRLFSEVARAYRSVYDLEAASMRSRLQARDNLAMLLISQAKAKEVIALYTDSERPICGALSADGTYALAAAYNAVGNDSQAQKIFDAGKASADANFKQDIIRWNDWLFLQLQLDCVQHRWSQCAADLEGFANMESPEFPPLVKLNKIMPVMRRIPELKQTIEGLEQRGIVDANGFLPTKWLYASELAVVSCPAPKFPDEAKTKRVAGHVWVQWVIDSQGKVKNVEIAESTPPGVFEVDTLVAAWQCKFNVDPTRPNAVLARRLYNFGKE